uniref:Vesicle transport protein n=1 Tax=Lotharella globosa TaxID=91324 RepID=A0A6U3D362_9EUKA|mmetsp:Transcript_6247/g.12417  ORF Transcript_6247/g.12417 Transcript_6247/m.12417 type:complete len:144 (-) Transcript_6247:195-626(-)
MFSDDRKIGIGLTVFGLIFLFLGVLCFFDTSLLTLGNVLFVSGICCLIGFKRTLKLFFGSMERWAGTGLFLLGFLLVLFRYPIIGMIIEAYGMFKLFFKFGLIINRFLHLSPVIGPILRLPIVKRMKGMCDYCMGRSESTLPE